MKIVFFFSFLLMAATGFTQAVSVIDFVKIKDNKRTEALYYYEQNWKLYREEALKKGVIRSYRLLTVAPDSTISYDLILITEYADSSQYKMSEQNFAPILKALRPNGPLLLNALKPSDFRQNLGYKVTHTLYEGNKL